MQTEAGAEEHFDGVSGEPCDDLWQVEADTAIHDQVVAAGRTSRG